MVNLAENICGIIISEASSTEEAKKMAEIMKNCPRLLTSGTTSKIFYAVYIVPEEKKWWLKYPEQNPEVIGAEKVWVHIVENLLYPEKFNLRLPKKKTSIAPCGANCQECPLRKEYDCDGCPATVHYRESKKI